MKRKLMEFLETDWESDAKLLKEEMDNMNRKSFNTFLAETKLEESQELQAMMALDDAGIEAVINRKGQIVINKKDLKNAQKAFKKSFRKGGAPELKTEEVEIKEDRGDDEHKALVQFKAKFLMRQALKSGKRQSRDWWKKQARIAGLGNLSPDEAMMAIQDAKKEEVEIDEGGHTDVISAKNQVKVAKSALQKMETELNKLSDESALPSWWTNKVAIAVDKLDGMADYLDTQVERIMTDAEMAKREKIVKSFKKKKDDFKDRYGDDAEDVMYATATKMAMKQEQPTTSTAGIAGLDIGLTKKKKEKDVEKAKMLRRQYLQGDKMSESIQRATFAGKDVFIVDSETFYNCRMGKKQYARYEKYVGDGMVGQAIREYGLKYPRRPIILQNGEAGPMLYLKYGRN